MKKEVIFCECGDTRDHIVIQDDNDDSTVLFIDIMSVEHNFFRKLKIVFEYLFLNKNNGLFGIIVNKEKFKKTINDF
jgi:hypothetical protein